MSQNLLLVLISFFLGIVLTAFIRTFDKHEKEPLSKMLLVLCWGAFWSVAIAAITYKVLDKSNIGDLENFFGAVFVIGPVEEAAKLLALLSAYFIFRKEINEPTDGLIYMTCVALGFSLVENYFYATQTAESGYLLFMRLFTSTPAHILFSIFMGIAFYIVVKHRVGYNLLFVSFLYASIVHGLYDAMIFQSWVLFAILLLMRMSWRWAMTVLSYTTSKSPFRKELKEFIEDYHQPEVMKGLECLNCGSKNDKQSFKHKEITLQQCDQCQAYVTTKNSLFEIFHFFGSSFKDLSEHYLDKEIHEEEYSTLYKGNYVSDDKNLAYFHLNELNDALITFNQSTIDNFEKNWWFPTKLRNKEQPKSTTAQNAIIWTTFITMALVCLGIAIFGKENTFSFSIFFSPIIIIFFGLTYAVLCSIFEKY